MKISFIKLLMLVVCFPVFFSSCWEDLPVYEDAEITKVGFYHRFAGSGTDVVTGEPIMVETELTCQYEIDSEAATVYVDVTVPSANGDFAEAERNNVKLENLWGYFNVSTAAKVTPINGSPTLGTPGDWSEPHEYEIMAASGFKKTWTVTVRSFSK